MNKLVFLKRPATLTLLLVLSCTARGQAATLLFETGSGQAGSTGWVISNEFWLFHRFEVSAPTRLKTVGAGLITGHTVIPVFAAIVNLSSSDDLPNSVNLSTDDVIGTGIIEVRRESSPSDFSANIDLPLAPGWYGVVLGVGGFGTPGSTPGGLSLSNYQNDLAPTQTLAQLVQPGGSGISNTIRIVPEATARFFATSVPEPVTSVQPLIALLGTFHIWRGKRQ